MIQSFLDEFWHIFLYLVYLKNGSFPVFDVHSGSSARFCECTSGEKIRRFLISMF